jgi:2-polyprenyl-6-methoxyphenol hydroxylase-like FAD-dependent oxidoreductase
MYAAGMVTHYRINSFAGVTVDGFTSVVIMPDGSQAETMIKEDRHVASDVALEDCFTWVPRHTFNAFLHAHIQERHGDVVKVHFGTSVQQVHLPASDAHDKWIGVSTSSVSPGGPGGSFVCNVLIGADGSKSFVQQELARLRPMQGWELRFFKTMSSPDAWKVCVTRCLHCSGIASHEHIWCQVT